MYITEQDLLDELGEEKLIQLTDTGNGHVDHGRVSKAIAYAVGTFDAYARTRYQLPVPVTDKVRAVCLDLAIFHLYKGRASVDEGRYRIWKDQHDAAIRFLEALQSGRAALDVPAVAETPTSPATPDRVLRSNARATFDDERLSRY